MSHVPFGFWHADRHRRVCGFEPFSKGFSAGVAPDTSMRRRGFFPRCVFARNRFATKERFFASSWPIDARRAGGLCCTGAGL